MKITAALLMLSAVAGPVAADPIHDHLKCHRVRESQTVSATADFDTGSLWDDAGCHVGPLRFVCVPATMTNVSPTPTGPPSPGPEQVGLDCYTLRCPKPGFSGTLFDEFGAHDMRVGRTSVVCVPQFSPTCSNTPFPQCGGTCTPPMGCEPNAGTDSCECRGGG